MKTTQLSSMALALGCMVLAVFACGCGQLISSDSGQALDLAEIEPIAEVEAAEVEAAEVEVAEVEVAEVEVEAVEESPALSATVTLPQSPDLAIPEPAEETVVNSTHEEIATIPLGTEDNPNTLRTFCLSAEGNLLACCGGDQITYAVSSSGAMEMQTVSDPPRILVLDPDGNQLATWTMTVTPQAINVAEDGTIFIGGDGKLGRLDNKGNLLASADAPHVADLGPLPEIPEEDPDEETDEQKQAKQAEIAEIRGKMTLVMKALVAANTAVRGAEGDEEATATARKDYDKALKEYLPLSQQLQALTTNPRLLAMRARSSALRKRAVTGIAVTGKDLFVACSATEGLGYDVWRMDLDFNNATKVVTGLRGCCSQMDIQAHGGDLFVAENSRGRVVQYDRDGNQITAWGKVDRNDPEGFGSCCNPMNIRFGPKAEVYTSEASVGSVKRFSADGQFLGLVGSVGLVPGCKHVAIGVSKDGDRVYMLDITRSHIAVLGRKGQAASSR